MTTPLRSRDPGPELPGLGRTLDRAADAADHEFDLGAIRLGIDGLVVHRRRRRRQLTSGLAAAAAVLVVGGSTWLLGPGRDLGQVAGPVPSPTAVAPSIVVGPTTPAAGESPSSAPTVPVAYPVPDAVQLTAADLGPDRVATLDIGDYANQPVATGQSCDTGATGPAPVAGRQWTYGVPGSESFDRQVDVVVTGWAAGTGPAAFEAVADDSGRCRWLDPVEVVPSGEWQGDQGHLVTTAPVFGTSRAIAVEQVGDLLVGATAYSDEGEDAAAAEAVRVADLVVGRLLAADVPGTGR